MPYAVRTFTCEGCGAPFEKRAKNGSTVRCINCNIARCAENVYQLREKRGEFYQRWVAGLAKSMVDEQVIAAASDVIESMG